METNPGWRAIKRARSVINDNVSACFPGSGSMTVISQPRNLLSMARLNNARSRVRCSI